jgi:hypothetical protein
MIKLEVIVEENSLIVSEGKYAGESGWLFLAFGLWRLFGETDRVRDQRVVHLDWWLIQVAIRWNLLRCVIINGFKSKYKVFIKSQYKVFIYCCQTYEQIENKNKNTPITSFNQFCCCCLCSFLFFLFQFHLLKFLLIQ